jgi:hypothetical protein
MLFCIVLLKGVSMLWLLELVGSRCNICKNICFTFYMFLYRPDDGPVRAETVYSVAIVY